MESRNFIQVQFQNITAAQNEILVALLSNIGFEGFEESDDLLKAFIKEADFKKEEVDTIGTGLGLSYISSVIEQQNWNAQWESSFEPVIIKDFASVRAGFHEPVKNVQYEIIITPKMSFGTGHHATTYLVMEQMSKLDLTNKTVLDFGTGTGILAILAEKMGAKEILAIDNDEWSIDNAKENLALNHSKKITIQLAEAITSGKTYDVILANINLNVILASMTAIKKACNAGGLILLSGFLNTDEAQIKASLSSSGLVLINITRQKDWICALVHN
jgi:ribosomal protein L11 methyltransferase